MTHEHLPPERINVKAIPMVVAVFAVAAAGMIGAALLVRDHLAAQDHIPTPVEDLLASGGAAFTARDTHLPTAWKDSAYHLVVPGQNGALSFADGPACAAAATFLASQRTPRDPALSCHPVGG